MAKLPNGLMGGFSGTIGPAVGSKWKNLLIIRSRPPRKTEENDPTRNAGSYILDVAAFSGKTVEPYIGFLSKDAKFVTTSLYTGSVNIL